MPTHREVVTVFVTAVCAGWNERTEVCSKSHGDSKDLLLASYQIRSEDGPANSFEGTRYEYGTLPVPRDKVQYLRL